MTIKNLKRPIVAAVAFFSLSSASAGYFDNRFIPWYPHLISKEMSKRTRVGVDGFLITGDSAYGDPAYPKKGIPELWGWFDQRIISQASAIVGNPNPLRPAWQLENIGWQILGKIQGQGVTLGAEHAFLPYLCVGGCTTLLHLSSNQIFVLTRDAIRNLMLTFSDQQELDRDRRETLGELGFNAESWSGSGWGDSLAYIRLQGQRDYALKCRHIEGSVTLGAVINSAAQRPLNEPAAISFGGEHIPGMYVMAAAEFEVKEDMTFSVLTAISKRFPKIQTRRLPVLGEPEIFAATTGAVRVDPGVTFIIAPKVTIEDVRHGFGFGLQYVFANHARDVWEDRRENTTIPVNFGNVNVISHWAAEYLLFNIFYDFSRVYPGKSINPVVSFYWDIPVRIFHTYDSAKTQRVGLSFEVLF